MSLIRDRTWGTSQLYLRLAWTSAFKQFFLFLSSQQVQLRHVNISIHISNVLDRGTCTKVFIDNNCWNFLQWYVSLKIAQEDGLYLLHDIWRFVNSGFRCSRFIIQKPLRASVTKKARKMLSYVTFCVLYELFGVNRTQKANKPIFSTNLSIYLAAKNGIWFMLCWKCFFTLCEVDYCRMNGKVRRAGGTWSVSSCPHLQRLVYRLFNSVFFTVFVLSWYRDLLFSEER